MPACESCGCRGGISEFVGINFTNRRFLLCRSCLDESNPHLKAAITERDALRAAVAELVDGLRPIASRAPMPQSCCDCPTCRNSRRAAELVAKYGGKEVGT
jgi:hypothetical protein